MTAENKDRSVLDVTIAEAKFVDGGGCLFNATLLAPAYLASFYLLVEGITEAKPDKIIIGGLGVVGLYEAGRRVKGVEEKIANQNLQDNQ